MTPEEQIREAAEVITEEATTPMIRSMYPTRSRGQMKNEFKHFFIEGAQFGRELERKRVLGMLRSEVAQLETWIICGNSWADWLEEKLK